MDNVPAQLPANPLLLDLQVCFPIYAASNLFTRVYRQALEPLGLTYSQYLVMLILWEQAPVSVGELGRLLHLDSNTLTPLLKRMEAGGLVERRRDAGDERRVLIGLTAHGRALRQGALEVPAFLQRSLDLSSLEIDQLRDSVKTLVNILAGHSSGDVPPEPSKQRPRPSPDGA